MPNASSHVCLLHARMHNVCDLNQPTDMNIWRHADEIAYNLPLIQVDRNCREGINKYTCFFYHSLLIWGYRAAKQRLTVNNSVICVIITRWNKSFIYVRQPETIGYVTQQWESENRVLTLCSVLSPYPAICGTQWKVEEECKQKHF